MAIINCPGCGQRVSDKAKACPHCQLPPGEASEQDLQRLVLRRWRKRMYRAQNIAYLGMAALIGGGVWWWLGASPGGIAPMPAVALIAVGVLAYAGGRGWLFWLKMKSNRPRGC